MNGSYNKKNKGLTLLEALVATVIVGIGFVAIFQMVQYSVRSIDVSSERNKGNYMVNLIAEDMLANKRSRKGDDEFSDVFRNTQWSIQQCSDNFAAPQDNTPDNKRETWNQYFGWGITKCESQENIKQLTIIDICNNIDTSEDKDYTCTFTNNLQYNYDENGNPVTLRIYDQRYFGKMEMSFNQGRATRDLYFQIK